MKIEKLFKNGRNQAVRLPAEFGLPGSEVYARQIAQSGDAVSSRRPGWSLWDEYFALRISGDVPVDFLADRLDEIAQCRDFGG